jgi:hypothetical protein
MNIRDQEGSYTREKPSSEICNYVQARFHRNISPSMAYEVKKHKYLQKGCFIRKARQFVRPCPVLIHYNHDHPCAMNIKNAENRTLKSSFQTSTCLGEYASTRK